MPIHENLIKNSFEQKNHNQEKRKFLLFKNATKHSVKTIASTSTKRNRMNFFHFFKILKSIFFLGRSWMNVSCSRSSRVAFHRWASSYFALLSDVEESLNDYRMTCNHTMVDFYNAIAVKQIDFNKMLRTFQLQCNIEFLSSALIICLFIIVRFMLLRYIACFVQHKMSCKLSLKWWI